MSRVLFVGFERRRVRSIVSSIETASGWKITAATCGIEQENSVDSESFEALFVNREVRESQLVRVLESVRNRHPEIPAVLTYGAEPDGKAYLYANRYNCMLFSEMDRFGRTLTARELAETLQEVSLNGDVTRKLMELSMSCGPCSTGE